MNKGNSRRTYLFQCTFLYQVYFMGDSSKCVRCTGSEEAKVNPRGLGQNIGNNNYHIYIVNLIITIIQFIIINKIKNN